MSIGKVYPLYVAKVERKGASVADLDTAICWLTGYSPANLAKMVASETSLDEFFAGATIHDNADLITGVICGVRVEQIDDPFMKCVRQLDKIVDEVANGRPLTKVLRA